MLWVLIRITTRLTSILMSTHNIGFYEDLTKIIFELSSNIIKYAPYFFCCSWFKTIFHAKTQIMFYSSLVLISSCIHIAFLSASNQYIAKCFYDGALMKSGRGAILQTKHVSFSESRLRFVHNKGISSSLRVAYY